MLFRVSESSLEFVPVTKVFQKESAGFQYI